MKSILPACEAGVQVAEAGNHEPHEGCASENPGHVARRESLYHLLACRVISDDEVEAGVLDRVGGRGSSGVRSVDCIWWRSMSVSAAAAARRSWKRREKGTHQLQTRVVGWGEGDHSDEGQSKEHVSNASSR